MQVLPEILTTGFRLKIKSQENFMKKKFLVFALILAFVCEAAIGQNKAGLNKIGGYIG